MKHLLLIFALLALVGCDSQTSPLDDASALIHIDGKPAEALASVSTRGLHGTAYQVVSLEMANGSQIEILALAFEQGRYEKQYETNRSFPFTFSYVEAGDRPSIYIARSGSLTLSVVQSALVEGTFEFETYNVTSSCMDCASTEGPQLSGRFRAVGSVR